MKPNYRRCVSCRRVGPKQEFWRLVRLAGGTTVCLDQGQGRSAYLCPRADCLRLAQRKNRLGRALKASLPETLWETLWQRLGETSQDPPPPPTAEEDDR
ncbi:MAG TPA: YlxR family protein [Leptolyngbyaceae cyanobacterium M65_K2018_010]|nr:YlxR family protein [Leptolyngbyaceae cyanobacterium M65_K2018_010]